MSNINETLEQKVARLEAENNALKQASVRALTLKVSQKGALSMYGMGRFPVTLYKEQWLRVLDNGDNIRDFIKTNDGKLVSKADKKPTPKEEKPGSASDVREYKVDSAANGKTAAVTKIN